MNGNDTHDGATPDPIEPLDRIQPEADIQPAAGIESEAADEASEHGPSNRARAAMGGKLEETAGRVRELGDKAAARNRLLAPTRPIAYDAARGIDTAADYVRTRELDAMKSDLETQVRRHPLASVAVAFLAGYTLRRIFW